MDIYLRSVTFEVPFEAQLQEASTAWFRDAVPSVPDTGRRRVQTTHGQDKILTAVHRDTPTIGLICPRPVEPCPSDENAELIGNRPRSPSSPPTQLAKASDANTSSVYTHIICPDAYAPFGVYTDDTGEPCLIISVRRTAFGISTTPVDTGAAQAALAQRRSSISPPGRTSGNSAKDGESSEDDIRLLLYSRDIIPAHACDDCVEVGLWSLLDSGQSNFLEAALSPNLQHICVHLTRAVHTAMDVPYSTLMHCDDPDMSQSPRFLWLAEHIRGCSPAAESQEPRLLAGPARHPVLAALHHDRPTIAIGWPHDDDSGESVCDGDGTAPMDVYTFPPQLYASGGLWYDEDLLVCMPVLVKFHDAAATAAASASGSAQTCGGGASEESQVSVVLLYAYNRVAVPGAIKEWGEWALVDAGKGEGLMQEPRAYPQCKEAPVLQRPLPWGQQRFWR